MTDQIDHITETDVEEIDSAATGRNKRRMFITGAGLAGAAAIVGTSGTANAADGDNVVLGAEGPGATPDANESTSTTEIYNSGTSTDRTNNALKGSINDAGNNSHAILATTIGDGHAIAGVVGTPDGPQPAAPVAATWGRSYAEAAATEGQSLTEDIGIAGGANGVKGIVESTTNGSHAVLGITNGGGHSIAGDTPADAAGPDGAGPNTTAATWGRHGGIGAGIGGVSAEGYGGEFIGGKSHVRLIQTADAAAGAPAGDDHLLGELYADGVGDLWYNTADGSNWVPLTKGGNVLFVDPQRASDTRDGSTPPNTDKTKYAAGETREVDLTLIDGFPPTATAALINLTVVNTEGERGFATVFNGDTADADRPNTSNINWSDSTEVIANSATVRANADGIVKIYVSEATDVIVDVQGYIA